VVEQVTVLLKKRLCHGAEVREDRRGSRGEQNLKSSFQQQQIVKRAQRSHLCRFKDPGMTSENTQASLPFPLPLLPRGTVPLNVSKDLLNLARFSKNFFFFY